MKDNSQELIIEGAGCASCVGKIEKAIKQVKGVTSASMNFAQRTVSITGDADQNLLILAVETAGYNAISTAGTSDDELLEEKDKADWIYYKRLMKEMTIALTLGIPLMIYGILIGEMTVTTTTERIVWLTVGLVTLAVMYFSGRHFYIGEKPFSQYGYLDRFGDRHGVVVFHGGGCYSRGSARNGSTCLF